MGKHNTEASLVRGALGNTVLLRVGKANGLKVAQLRALLGVAGLRSLGLIVSASLVEARAGFPMRTGRVAVYEVIALGFVARVTVGKGRNKRITLELTASGLGVVSQYERAERAAVRGFVGAVS